MQGNTMFKGKLKNWRNLHEADSCRVVSDPIDYKLCR